MKEQPPAVMYDSNADPSLIKRERVAIIGYGSQGHAHALNLKDSGVEIKVGLHAARKSRERATSAGLQVESVAEASQWATIVMILAPDTRQPAIWNESIAPHLEPQKTVMFGHGFNIRYGTIVPPEGVDVSMIAPKGPGHRVRETYLEGGGVPALLAVHQDSSGQAEAKALSYAWALGSAR
ncbi:MAG: NAD(P)-binding domain-containing protein, partial [Myxococcota bacterium]